MQFSEYSLKPHTAYGFITKINPKPTDKWDHEFSVSDGVTDVPCVIRFDRTLTRQEQRHLMRLKNGLWVYVIGRRSRIGALAIEEIRGGSLDGVKYDPDQMVHFYRRELRQSCVDR